MNTIDMNKFKKTISDTEEMIIENLKEYGMTGFYLCAKPEGMNDSVSCVSNLSIVDLMGVYLSIRRHVENEVGRKRALELFKHFEDGEKFFNVSAVVLKA